MADYHMRCATCGKGFTASRRNAQFCSDRCRQKMRYEGGPLSDMGSAETEVSLPVLRVLGGASDRVYALYRGRLDQAETLIVGDRGIVTGGYLAGRTIGDVLRTAAREGWLAYRRRPDGWYSAEWADGRIALCGARARPCLVALALSTGGKRTDLPTLVQAGPKSLRETPISSSDFTPLLLVAPFDRLSRC
jgi:hypothetical protein